MPDIGGLIEDTLNGNIFKNSAKGVAEIGRDHFSQAVQIISIGRGIDFSRLKSVGDRDALKKSVRSLTIFTR